MITLRWNRVRKRKREDILQQEKVSQMEGREAREVLKEGNENILVAKDGESERERESGGGEGTGTDVRTNCLARSTTRVQVITTTSPTKVFFEPKLSVSYRCCRPSQGAVRRHRRQARENERNAKAKLKQKLR